ncbi:MAG: hypothetical protein LRY54_04370 [Alphaproteobacteria bacterium]|nr:hypothetical protein [Alphaproteobacteria bacterium]
MTVLWGGIIDANDGDTIAAGERFYDEGENIGLTLRKINGRGRTQWERILNNYGFEKIVRIIGLEKGFLVLANKGGSKQPSTVWAGFFDSEGNLAESRDIKPPSGALKAFDILPLNNGRAFILSGQVTDGAEAPYTALYRLDRKAQITSRKAYQMGLENGLLSLASGKGGIVYGSGYILDQNGRRNAWVVKLKEDGGIIWQRQYARGKAAEFTKVQPYKKDGVLLLGNSRPYNLKTPESRNIGGWVTCWRTAPEILSGSVFTASPIRICSRAISLCIPIARYPF